MKKDIRTVPLTKTIKCRDCGKEFEVPRESKRYLCDECKIKSFKNHFSYTVEQKILCRNPKCQNVVKTVIKKGKGSKSEIRGAVLCDYCREHRPMKEQEIRCPRCGALIEKVLLRDTYQLKTVKFGKLCDNCRKERDIEIKKEFSERMKSNNPMYDPETRKKVSSTFVEKIKKGEIEYPSGKNHYLFKGTRQFGMDVRSHLYTKWTKPILIRDNFRCTKCGSQKNLQVHHIYPLRNIIKEVFDELNIKEDSAYFTREDIGDTLYEEALKLAIEKHKLDYGVTLCKDCHEKEDYYYRPYKDKGKEINDEQSESNKGEEDYI